MSNAAASLPSTSRLPILELPTLAAQRTLELRGSDADVAPGHTAALVCAVALAAVKHVLWAKGQIADPVAIMERQRRNDQVALNGKRSTVKGARQRKRDKVSSTCKTRRVAAYSPLTQALSFTNQLLSAMEALSISLSSALEVLSAFPPTSSARSFPLLLLHGPSLLLPRALSLIHLQAAVPTAQRNTEQEYDEAQRLAQDKRRRKQEGALERRLVRFLVEAGNDAEGEAALGLNKPLGEYEG